jgi:WD40 repeat protein
MGLILWGIGQYFKSSPAQTRVGVHTPPELATVEANPNPTKPKDSSTVPNDSKSIETSKTPLELEGGPGVIATWFEIGQGPVIRSMAFSVDGSHCLIGHEDNALSYWEVSTGQRIHLFKDLGGPVDSISFSPDGRSAISVAGMGKPVQWDLRTFKSLREYAGPGSGWRRVSFAPDGQHALVGCEGSPNLIYWETMTGKTTAWVGHNGAVLATAFSSNGQSAISGDSNGGTIVWNVATGEKLHEFKKLEGAVTCVRLSPDGQTAFTGNYTIVPRLAPGFVRVWSLHSGQPMEMRRMPGTFFEISADGTRVLGNGEGNAPHSPTMMLDFKQGQWCESTYPCESPRYECAVRTMSPDGNLALIAGRDRRLLLWRLPKQ